MASVSQSLERVYETYYGLILFTKLEKLWIWVNGPCAFHG